MCNINLACGEKAVKNRKKDKRIKVRKAKRKKMSRKNLVITLIALAVILCSGTLGVARAMGYNVLTSNPFASEKEERFKIKASLDNSSDLKGRVNILVFGIDRNESRSKEATIFRPDTIMLASVDMDKKTVDLISLPRDSRVMIYNTGGYDKINSCFYYASMNMDTSKENEDAVFKAGIKSLKKTVSSVLNGVRIDYYVGIDMDALPKIADVMGGVTINVHQDLYARNGHDRSAIRIHKGTQVLNGKQLLYYSRYRMYEDGDIGRVAIQQKIMKAIFNEFKKKKSFAKIPQIYNLVSDMVLTDMKMAQIASMGYAFKDFDIDNIKTYTLPGGFGNMNNISYWIINESKIDSLTQKVFGIKPNN